MVTQFKASKKGVFEEPIDGKGKIKAARYFVYATIADYLGCHREEIALTENATRAWQSVFTAIPFQKGDVIVTSQSEYHSNFIPFLQLKKRVGIEIKIIPHNASGEICLDRLEAAMDERVRLVALTHIPTNNGLVNDAQAVGKIVKRFPALYLLDACQSAGQMPLSVNDLGCDFLVASGRKFLRGPRGTGFLYARRESHADMEPNIADGLAAEWVNSEKYLVRSDARKFETWEKNIGLFLGLGAAVKYHQDIGPLATWNRIHELARYARTLLASIPKVTIHDTGSILSGIITFTIAGINPCESWRILADQGIFLGYTSTQSTRIDMEARSLECVFRASVHYFNLESEINLFAEKLSDFISHS
jgi:selenocysteine lyase/cysteine desulfurase